jgi:phospholipid transport system substrate-binding protein
MRRVVIALSMLVVSLAAPAADATPPDQLVRQVTDRVLSLIKANRDEYARDHEKLFAAVDKEVLRYFDFKVMSRSVLALNWRRASDDQRERFVKEFRELLVRTYATALLKYNDEKVRYLPVFAKPDDKQVLVRTEIIPSGGGPNIPLHYSFYRSTDGWKVYDVSIEGVSLVTNYRSTYAEKVRNAGLDALIATLSADNRRAREQSDSAKK